MTEETPSRHTAKNEARLLRLEMAQRGEEVSHSEALETVAKRYGFKDWNGFCAATGPSDIEHWQVGNWVEGTYLSQAFRARISALSTVDECWTNLTLELEQAVDVVKFEGFMNKRKKLKAIIGPKGYSKEKTSDGNPHFQNVRLLS